MKIDEFNKRIDEVLKTDATFAREADFMITHVPFRKLYNYIPNSGHTRIDETGTGHYYIDSSIYKDKLYFSEQELLERFAKNPDSYKFYLVQGISGTGKSNLIRWIYYNYRKLLEDAKDKSEQIIFIERSYNNIKDVVKRILNYNILSQERTQYYLDKIGGGSQAAKGEELAETIYAMLQIVIKYSDSYEEYISEDVFSGLIILMQDENIKKNIFLKSNGPIERLCSRIESREGSVHDTTVIFDEKDFSFKPQEIKKVLYSDGHNASQETFKIFVKLFTTPAYRRQIVRFFNSLNEVVIARSSNFDVTDIQSIFKEIRTELRSEGKKLTIFIEDINAYTGIDEMLIEILIDEGKAEDKNETNLMCRLQSMVGSTDNFYDGLRTNVESRITDSIVVLDDSMLESRDKLLEFGARYINAINLSREEIDKWYYDNGEYPVAPIKNKVCSVLLDGKEFNIYPFTREAIINLFNCLEPVYKTPRGLLKYVLKNVLSTWSTLEGKIFESFSNFLNIGIKNFSNLKIAPGHDLIIGRLSAKERVYTTLWGYDYENKRIVNVSENEGVLFGISSMGAFPAKQGIQPKENVQPTTTEPHIDNHPKTVQQPSDPKVNIVVEDNRERDDILNHINEWENSITDFFAPHKNMRQWIISYILGHINWELEGILYSKAKEVCSKLSFIYIDGQDSKYINGYRIERNHANAEFFKAITYFHFNGKGKRWDFENGMERRIIAKAWLENNREDIILALKRFCNYSQYSSEYIVQAKLYSVLVNGEIRALNVDQVIETLTRTEISESTIRDNSAWSKMSIALKKNNDVINNLFAEQYRRAVGSSKTDKTKYYYIDVISLKQTLSEILARFTYGQDEKITLFGEKNLEPCVENINIYHQMISDVEIEMKSNVEGSLKSFKKAFGNNISKDMVAATIKKMQEYIDFVYKQMNQPVPSKLIAGLEENQANIKIEQLYSDMDAYLSTGKRGEGIVILQNLNYSWLLQIKQEIIRFEDFMGKIENTCAGTVSSDMEKQITEKRELLTNKIRDSIKIGDEN